MSDKGFHQSPAESQPGGDVKKRPSTVMDRIFDSPLLYRAKITAIAVLARPIALTLMHNRFSADEILLREIPDGSKVYEIGCGDGNHFRLFQQRRRKIEFAGSDYNDHMVDYCRRTYPTGKWEYYHGGRYEHPDNQFDFCIIRNVLHHITDRKDIVLTVKEAVRIAPRVILFEPLQSDNRLLHAIKSVYWRITDGGLHYQRLDELHATWAEAGAEVVWEIPTAPLRQAYAGMLKRRNG